MIHVPSMKAQIAVEANTIPKAGDLIANDSVLYHAHVDSLNELKSEGRITRANAVTR